MALHALKIVKEEFEIGREILKSPTAEAEMVLANCEHAISERIKTECIEQPDPDGGDPPFIPNDDFADSEFRRLITGLGAYGKPKP